MDKRIVKERHREEYKGHTITIHSVTGSLFTACVDTYRVTKLYSSMTDCIDCAKSLIDNTPAWLLKYIGGRA